MVFAGFMAVVHQRLEGHGDGGRRQLSLYSLFVTPEHPHEARGFIRQRKFEQLKNAVQLQKNKMIVANRNVQPA
jgi:hypothetical protein